MKQMILCPLAECKKTYLRPPAAVDLCSAPASCLPILIGAVYCCRFPRRLSFSAGSNRYRPSAAEDNLEDICHEKYAPCNLTRPKNFPEIRSRRLLRRRRPPGLALPRNAHRSNGFHLVATADRARILSAANRYIDANTFDHHRLPTKRSAGGPHDFYSQADYFWPNPKIPMAPTSTATDKAIRITSTIIAK